MPDVWIFLQKRYQYILIVFKNAKQWDTVETWEKLLFQKQFSERMEIVDK